MKLYNIIDFEEVKPKFQLDFLLEEESDIHLIKRIAQMMYLEFCISTTVDMSSCKFELQKRYLMTFE